MFAKKLGERVRLMEISGGERIITGIRCIDSGLDRTVFDTLYLVEDADNERMFHLINRNDRITIMGENISEALNAVLSVQDFYQAWEYSLQQVVDSGGSLQDLMDVLMLAIDNPAFISSTFGRILAISLEYETVPVDKAWDSLYYQRIIPPAKMNLPMYLHDGTPSGDFTDRPEIYCEQQDGYSPYIGAYVFEDGEPLVGICVIQYKNELTELDKQLVAVAADSIKKMIPGSIDTGLESRPAVLRGILEGSSQLDEDAMTKLFSAFPQDERLQLLVFRNRFREDVVQKRMLINSIRRICPNSLSAPLRESVVSILSCSDAKELLKDKSGTIIDNFSGIGVSLPFIKPSSLVTRYNQARFALECAGDTPGIFYCKDYSYSRILKELRDFEESEELSHPALEVLRDYDARNKGALYETLKRYLICERNLSKCASMLFIHKNTLLYRLKRIEDLIGTVMDSDEERLYLFLSFLIAD